MKYSILTFGCRVNQADSIGFEEELLARGHASSDVADADLVVVNTCSVTATADHAARQSIRRIARLNPGARVVVTGCYATRRPEELRDLPNITSVVPNDGKPNLIQLVLDSRSGVGLVEDDETTASMPGLGDGDCGAHIKPGIAGRTAFTLRVQTGCAEPCAYCIIPSTRGKPRSRPVAEVVAEAARVREAGFKEIAITGVHLGGYGRDLAPECSLLELLRALETVAFSGGSDILFRISSLEPKDCTPDIIDVVSGSRAFAPHFHLPLQHASARMLDAMRRPYTIDSYSAIVDRIRERLPTASIGSDLIVGFPGETDADADELANYLERSPLTHLHVFPYSDRPGTAAALLTPKVPGLVIRERASRLRQISERLSRRFKQSQRGIIHRALTIDDGSTVVTGNYLKLRIADGLPRNVWVDVQVDDDAASHGRVIAAASV